MANIRRITGKNGVAYKITVTKGRNQNRRSGGGSSNNQKTNRRGPQGQAPAVLCVMCSITKAVYQRPDGVFVIPETAMKE